MEEGVEGISECEIKPWFFYLLLTNLKITVVYLKWCKSKILDNYCIQISEKNGNNIIRGK